MKKELLSALTPQRIYEDAPTAIYLIDSSLLVTWENSCARSTFGSLVGYRLFPQHLPYNFVEKLSASDTALNVPLPAIGYTLTFISLAPEEEGSFVVHATLSNPSAEQGNFWSSPIISTASTDSFRSAINIIFSNILLLSKSSAICGNEDTYAELKEINTQCFRLLRNSDNLGRYVSLQLGSTQPRFSHCNISELLQNLCLALRLEFSVRAQNVELITNIPEGDAIIQADVALLSMALLNIIGNSLKFRFCDDDLRLKISLQQHGEDSVLSITDNGPGIPPELIEKIYEPFFIYRHEDSSEPGLGLGLTVARSIIRLHSGNIFTSSLEDGGMSTTIILPKTPEACKNATASLSTTELPPYNPDYFDRYSPLHIILSDRLDPPMP